MYAVHLGFWFPDCGALPAAAPAAGLGTQEEPHRARSCKNLCFRPGTVGSHSLFWHCPDHDTQDPGSHSQSWKATSSGGCKSFCPFPCISSLFEFWLFLPCLFTWLVPVPPCLGSFPEVQAPSLFSTRSPTPALLLSHRLRPAHQTCLNVPSSP